MGADMAREVGDPDDMARPTEAPDRSKRERIAVIKV